MKKIALILFLTVVTANVIKAQHCAWDLVSAIIVEVRDNTTGQLINDLEIVLTDSLGKPYKIEGSTGTKFKQNKEDYKKHSVTGGPLAFEQHYYVLPLAASPYPALYRRGNALIVIKDKDGVKNGGEFETKSTAFFADNIVSLCTSHEIWNDEKSMEKVTILVMLDRAK